MLFSLFLILLNLGGFIFIQYRKHHQANELYNQAKELKKIEDRKRFQSLLSIGRKNSRQGFFKEALDEFIKAKKLFVTKELEAEISKCQQSIEQQEKYEKILGQSVQVARQGQFEAAINLLKPALDKFSREDGQQLLSKLQRVISAKELYKSGLSAENTNKFKEAIPKYEQALNLLPEFIECKIRLGTITVKTHPNKSIFYLEKVEGQQAAYIRGFAYTQLGNWQQANREWKSIRHNRVNSQREIIKSLAERDRLSQIKEIESAVDRNNIEIAKTLSLEFINKFGSEPTVQQNLKNHIQPILERQIWESQNWQQIATKTEQIWLEQQDINSLHNWAVASYYLSQIDSGKLANFIIAWSTALANIEQNPILQNIPWLGTNSIDIKEVSAKLKQILENAIDAFKDDDIENYLKLRDIYRRDMVSIYQKENSSIPVGVKVDRIFIPSGCYQLYRHKLTGITFPVEKLYSKSIQAALYTDWGLAVAACLEGDIARAIKIKPYQNPSSEADNFAYSFVSYHEGCYYLYNLEWRKAIKPLQQAQSEIKAKSDWCKEIDRLGEAQRQKIDNFDEHVQFSKFWYELLDTQPSRSYFAEQQVIQVAQNLDDKKISLQKGLDELKKLQKMDPNNSLTLDLIKKLEFNVELEKIDRLMKQNQFKEAVRVAKRSQNEQIRFIVAEICLKILLEGLKNNDLPFELINQLGNWAYELCPHEPAFVPFYRQLGIYR